MSVIGDIQAGVLQVIVDAGVTAAGRTSTEARDLSDIEPDPTPFAMTLPVPLDTTALDDRQESRLYTVPVRIAGAPDSHDARDWLDAIQTALRADRSLGGLVDWALILSATPNESPKNEGHVILDLSFQAEKVV